MMQVVPAWTGRRASLLQQAYCATNEEFAAQLEVSTRMVAYWKERPDTVPLAKTRKILDNALDRANERVQAKFAALLEERDPAPVTSAVAPAARLDADKQERIRQAVHSPKRLDAASISDLDQALTGQRHADDIFGPDLILDGMSRQRDVLEKLLRDARGPHRGELARLVANWTTFVGWLHTERAARGDYTTADSYFAKGESLADEAGDGILASTATSYRGYLALLQGNHRAAIRYSMAAIATPGAHATQNAYDRLQAAQAYAGLGDTAQARALLQQTSDVVTAAGTPPGSVYWYTEPFFRMNIGLAQYSIGQHQEAADSIRSGLADLPADQQQAEWVTEYRQALDQAEAQEPG